MVPSIMGSSPNDTFIKIPGAGGGKKTPIKKLANFVDETCYVLDLEPQAYVLFVLHFNCSKLWNNLSLDNMFKLIFVQA